MRLTILGSGTAYPWRGRCGPGYLVTDSLGRSLLLELSPGALHRAARWVAFEDLGAVVLSHLHPDHSSDLVTLLFALNWPGSRRTRPMYVIGPPGLGDRIAALGEVYGHWVREPDTGLVVETWRGSPIVWEGWNFEARPVSHSAMAHGWRITSPEGRILAYTGDSGPCPELLELADGADLLLSDCSLPPGGESASHLSPEQVGELAREAGVSEVVLTHMYPDVDPAEAREICASMAGVPCHAAEDGLVFEVAGVGQ